MSEQPMHKLSEIAQHNIDVILSNPVVDYCRLYMDDAVDIRDRATELEMELALYKRTVDILFREDDCTAASVVRAEKQARAEAEGSEDDE